MSEEQQSDVVKVEEVNAVEKNEEMKEKGDVDSADDCKICVLNFGKWVDSKPMAKVLDAIPLKYKSIQKRRQLSMGFILFDSKKERDAALDILASVQYNGELLEAKAALPKKSMKPMKKRSRPATDESQVEKKKTKGQTNNDEENEKEKTVVEAATPWWNVPYQEQLIRKECEMRKVVVKIVRTTRKEYAKKQKRVQQEALRVSRKTKEKPREIKVDVPSWLDSSGSIYAVISGQLMSKSHSSVEKMDETEPWKSHGPANNIVCMVSFGGELVGADCCGAIFIWNCETLLWDSYGPGPECGISSMASFRGELYCTTVDGRLLKASDLGIRLKSGWSSVAVDDSLKFGSHITGMSIHFSWLYMSWRETSDSPVLLYRAEIKDLSSPLAFEICDTPGCDIAGMASHNGKLLLALKSREVKLVDENNLLLDGFSIPGVDEKAFSISGFASHKGLACPMNKITPSPMLDGYRNKCEFTIGFDENSVPCVGFRRGLFRHGSVVVGSPADCKNVSDTFKRICVMVQEFVSNSPLDVYNVQENKGVWRTLTLRESRKSNEIMAIIQIKPSDVDKNDKETELDRLVKLLTSNALINVTSIFVQEYNGVSTPSDNDPIVHIHGKTYFEEELLGLKFQVSPQAFFQVNTPAAEKLYRLVRDQADLNKKTLLYDVCCGTGTIGLCCASSAGKVVGIELCKPATDDAVKNALLNNISNTSFINSKAEDVMKELLLKKREESEKDLDKIIAIVDPPRGGLHINVIRALRSCEPISRIVYVSCNPTKSLIEDASRLCGPKTSSLQGTAFQPNFSAPVDMFPYTPHCEMVMVFDRISN